MKPIVHDLFCGLGGWAEGFLSEGYECIGYDIEKHDYGTGTYPGTLILCDVRSIHGSQCKDAAVIVASPPCQAYSYRAMPWKRAKALPPPDNTLFNECFRIQREASEAAGHYIPLIVENVRGAERWVGSARWHFGSYYLWGDVPALMPPTFRASRVPGFRFDGSGASFQTASVNKNRGAKTPEGNCSQVMWKDREVARYAHPTPEEMQKQGFKAPGQTSVGGNPDGRKVPGLRFDGQGSFQTASVKLQKANRMETKQPKRKLDTFGWPQQSELRQLSSRSPKRKAASAQIAKIPFPLAQHIARCFKPHKIEMVSA